MGLLDDAIRQHLELKRRRGADPAEVERAEREALGPVRRGPEGPALMPEDAEDRYEAADEQYEPPRGSEWDGLSEADARRGGPAELEDDLGYEEEFPAAPPPARPQGAYAEDDSSAAVSPRPRPEAPPLRFVEDDPAAGRSPRDPPLGEDLLDTSEHEAVPPSPGLDEDVLEETPEFLQDTPDHDRLWFEQRPPRDFDFDG
jgi:hypothetical protein